MIAPPKAPPGPAQELSLAEQSPAPKLRLVSPRYGPAVVGGTEMLMRRLATSLASAGWTIEVLTTCARDEATWANADPPGTETDGEVRVRRFAVRHPRHPLVFRQFTKVMFSLPSAVRPEMVWINAQGPTSRTLVNALANEPPVPTLFSPYLYHPTIVGLPRAGGPRILSPGAHDEAPLRLRAVGRAVAAAGALLYHTEEERALLERIHPVARDRPAEVGTVGVEPPRAVDSQRFRERHRVTAPYLLYGGRGGRHKGLDQLTEGVERLRSSHPDVELVLHGEAGSGLEPRPWLRTLGHLDERDRWDAIAGATAVVVASSLESLSLLVLEAWAVGRPVLVNAATPVLVAQVQRSGGGSAFRGPEELARAAAQLLDDPASATALGESGRAYVRERYRWPEVHARIERLIGAAQPAHRP